MRASHTLSLLAAPVALAQSLTSSKRGLVYVDSKDASTDDKIWDSNSDLTWYYNYGASPTAVYTGSDLEFVPMLWGATAGNTDTSFLDTVTGLIKGGAAIKYVLGFNEPDGCISGGACVDAVTAADTWIREIEPLKKLGVKLGAPAVTGSPNGFNWLQNWFTACDGGCTPDFIPVHWYGNFEGLASHVGQVNATYENMTMWVTEYACAGCSLADSQSFYNESASFFDRIDYITHYSYFGSFRSSVSNVGPNAAMLTQKGELTDIGAWYLGRSATGNVPKGGAAQVAKFAGWVGIVATATLWSLI